MVGSHPEGQQSMNIRKCVIAFTILSLLVIVLDSATEDSEIRWSRLLSKGFCSVADGGQFMTDRTKPFVIPEEYNDIYRDEASLTVGP